MKRHRTHLESVMPLDRGPRCETTALRNICWNCRTRYWTGGADADKCPKCGRSFSERDVWKAESFVPERLLSAREGRGFDAEQLAARVGGSVDVLRMFEAPGAPRKPDRGEILALSRALDFPPGWFTLPWDDDLISWTTLDLHAPKQPCAYAETDGVWCFEDAARLCDFALAGGGTCDRPICVQHGKRVGHDRDYCIDHVRMLLDRPKAAAPTPKRRRAAARASA